MPTMNDALRRIKGNLSRFLPARLLARLASQTGKATRKRTLTPQTTTSLFFRQILQGNIPVGELRRLAGIDFTESAYCQARGRLSLGYFQSLNREIANDAEEHLRRDRRGRWRRKHRVFLLDGSSFSMPDTAELREAFGYPPGQKEGCGFPTAHLLIRTDLCHGTILDVLAAPWITHDLARARHAHSGLREGDVVVADRAFCSYAHLALLSQRGVHAVMRAHQRQHVDFTPGRGHADEGTPRGERAGKPRSRWVRSLGSEDQVVEYFKPKECPGWMSPEEYESLPASLLVRELRVKVLQEPRRVEEVTLVATVLDPGEHPKRAVGELFESRWGVEEHLKALKVQLHLRVLRTHTVLGVLKELYVTVSIYNLVRRVMSEAARNQNVRPDRISFADALYWLRYADSGEKVPTLKLIPQRPGRAEPRVKKRRDNRYPLMTVPREKAKQRLREK